MKGRVNTIYHNHAQQGVRRTKNDGRRATTATAWLVALLLCTALLLQGCTGKNPTQTPNPPNPATAGTQKALEKFSYGFVGTFDTVITITAYAENQAQFDDWMHLAEERFTQLHQLYDQFNDYPNVHNIKTINDMAGKKSVQVDPRIIGMLKRSIELYEQTGSKVNVAMGAVLKLWSEARDQMPPRLPDQTQLVAAAQHMDIRKIVIDEQASTVFLDDPQMSLDVGAVAKGYATALIAQELEAAGAQHVLINSGSSSLTLVGRPSGRDNWVIGIRNPLSVLPDPDDPPGPPPKDVPENIALLKLHDKSISTSGDYQRFVSVDGHTYHHLIDPATLYPAQYFRSVTVVADDGTDADFLSSALFLLPYEESRALAQRLGNIEAMWVFSDMRIEMTEGLRDWVQEE